NTSTGRGTDVGGPDSNLIKTIAFGRNGNLYGGNGGWYRIDKTTGEMSSQISLTPGSAEGLDRKPIYVMMAPTTFNVYRGRFIGGGIGDLGDSDDHYLAVGNGLTALRAESPIMVAVRSTLTDARAAYMELGLEQHVSITGLLQQLEAFDFQADAYQ